MRLFSLDIETTGLDEKENQIIEVGGIIDDLSDPQSLDELPTFHCYVTHDSYQVSEYCLGLHSETGIFQKLSNREEDSNYVTVDRLAYELGEFVYRNYLEEDERVGRYSGRGIDAGEIMPWRSVYDHVVEDEYDFENLPMKVIVAGKNFNGFDLDFLQEVSNLTDLIQFYRRVIDPGSLYARPSDDEPPALDECKRRAGLDDTVTHHALDDAMDVLKLVRNHYNIPFE